MKSGFRKKMYAFFLLSVASCFVSRQVFAQLNNSEQTILDKLDTSRTRERIQYLSTGVVKSPSGAGDGTAVAGSPEEKSLANYLENQMKGMGLDVTQEPFPARHYQYGPVTLTVNGKAVIAISLHAAGGTWGIRDGVPYARGNEDHGRRVRAALVDVGDGYAADYARVGDVHGKAVLVRRGDPWPVYPILEAAHRGAAALLMYDFPGAPDDAIKQDSMWYHEQLATVSLSKASAHELQAKLKSGPVEIALENRIDVADGFSQNVVGTIRGSELPNEWIMVSAHYDRWWQSANDNCAGVATMLEVARVLSANYHPRRSLLFVATGGEESGIEATEFDWLAGSHAFVNAHPEIMRHLVYDFNIDLAGWTSSHGDLTVSRDMAASWKDVLADLGLTNRITIRPGLSPVQDSWNFSIVGGGGSGLLDWGDHDAPHPFSHFYHTNLDIYHPEDFKNLPDHLRVAALGVLRMDEAKIVPIKFSDVASWVQESLESDSAKVPEVSFKDAEEATQAFRSEADRVETVRSNITSQAQATPVNLLLMKVRKDLMPWLYFQGPNDFRTSGYAGTLTAVTAARAMAEKGDHLGMISALEQVGTNGDDPVRALSLAAAVSPDVAREEQLYWYTSGDWSAAYEQKQRPLDIDLVDIYRRLQNGADIAAEVPRLRQIEDEARGRLSEALFVVAGKLRTATADLQESPLP
jgi:hypothetical protein